MTYRVTDTRETTTMTQAGSTRTLYRVWLVTDQGSTGTIDVPKDKWNEADLRPLLEAKAAELDLAFAVAG